MFPQNISEKLHEHQTTSRKSLLNGYTTILIKKEKLTTAGQKQFEKDKEEFKRRLEGHWIYNLAVLNIKAVLC